LKTSDCCGKEFNSHCTDHEKRCFEHDKKIREINEKFRSGISAGELVDFNYTRREVPVLSEAKGGDERRAMFFVELLFSLGFANII